jgi:GT2 family glycosyltransferase
MIIQRSTGDINSEEVARIAVVLVNYNGLSDTLECLDSLGSAMDDAVSVYVVENGSATNDAPRIGEAHPWATVIDNGRNDGWSGGNNVGIRAALKDGAQWVLLLNNDTVVAADLFQRLRAAATAGEFQVLGPLINEYDDRSKIQTEGIYFNPAGGSEFFSRAAVPACRQDPPKVVPCDIVNGCAVMISSEVFAKIGLIDERFFLICEESDFCLRALQADFRCGVISESLIWHKHSVTFARAGNSLQRYYGIRNLRLLLRKHPRAVGRRGLIASILAYHKYTYHLYSHDREHGGAEGAKAVVTGWVDGLLRLYGQRRPMGFFRQSLVYILDMGLWSIWRVRGGAIDA